RGPPVDLFLSLPLPGSRTGDATHAPSMPCSRLIRGSSTRASRGTPWRHLLLSFSWRAKTSTERPPSRHRSGRCLTCGSI
uniref:Uncharacterized protein n=1 Tax=Aegilops tauschii subsp. strangulata TaxID=200361 RepID=A0A452XU63_AEGTS